jgi:hypothetical protein
LAWEVAIMMPLHRIVMIYRGGQGFQVRNQIRI